MMANMLSLSSHQCTLSYLPSITQGWVPPPAPPPLLTSWWQTCSLISSFIKAPSLTNAIFSITRLLSLNKDDTLCYTLPALISIAELGVVCTGSIRCLLLLLLLSSSPLPSATDDNCRMIGWSTHEASTSYNNPMYAPKWTLPQLVSYFVGINDIIDMPSFPASVFP